MRRESAPSRNPDGAAQQTRLARPDPRFARSFRQMAEEFQASGELRYSACLHQIQDDFASYVEDLRRKEGPRGLAAGRVPQTEFWLVDENETVLGTIRFRHALTPELESEGGHIGYDIRPSRRCRGHGKRILALLLAFLKEAGWRRVLLTCDSENAASVAVIEANGGELEDQRLSRRSGGLVNRYWIEIQGRDAGP